MSIIKVDLNLLNNVKFEILTSDRINEAASVVAQAFSLHEPMAAHLNISMNDLKQFSLSLCHEFVDQELSIVAIDKKTNTVIGAMLTHDPALSGPLTNLPDSMAPILSLLHEVEQESSSPSEAYVEQFMAAVHKDYEGKGVNTNMAKFARLIYIERGYKYTMGTVTSPVTYYMAEKMIKQGCGDFKRIKYYDEFVYQGKNIFKDIEKNLPNHIQWVTGRPKYGVYVRSKLQEPIK